jgi:hypothetical protein
VREYWGGLEWIIGQVCNGRSRSQRPLLSGLSPLSRGRTAKLTLPWLAPYTLCRLQDTLPERLSTRICPRRGDRLLFFRRVEFCGRPEGAAAPI